MADAQLVQNPQDWLINGFRNWVNANYGHVQEAGQTRGGWEVWAQLELYFALNPFVPNPVQREQNNIWAQSPNSKVDFWLTWNGNDANNQPFGHWGIEIKCRTASESHASFLMRFLGDFDKCNQEPAVQHNPCAMYAVGISSDLADTTGYTSWGHLGETDYTIIQNPQGAGTIYMIWRRFEH